MAKSAKVHNWLNTKEKRSIVEKPAMYSGQSEEYLINSGNIGCGTVDQVIVITASAGRVASSEREAYCGAMRAAGLRFM